MSGFTRVVTDGEGSHNTTLVGLLGGLCKSQVHLCSDTLCIARAQGYFTFYGIQAESEKGVFQHRCFIQDANIGALVEKWFYVLHNGFAPTYLFSFIGYLGPSRILPLPTQGYLNLVVQLQWLRLRWRASLQESLDGKQGKESWEMVLSCTPGHLRFEL